MKRNERDLCTLTKADITDGYDIVKSLKPKKAATRVKFEENSPTMFIIFTSACIAAGGDEQCPS